MEKYKFKLDETNWIESIPNETDMARIEGEIREARKAGGRGAGEHPCP